MADEITFIIYSNNEELDKAAVELTRLRGLFPEMVDCFLSEVSATELVRLCIHAQDQGMYEYIVKPSLTLEKLIEFLRHLESCGRGSLHESECANRMPTRRLLPGDVA